MTALTIDGVQVLADAGHTDSEIAAMLGIRSRQAVLRFRKKHGIEAGGPVGLRGVFKPERKPVELPPEPEPAPSIQFPPRPFAVPVPAPAKSLPLRDVRRALILPDTHIPFQDDRAVAVAEKLIQAYDPQVLVHIGDLLDAGRLSKKFPTDPKRIDTLQDDLDAAKTKLHQWAELAPDADRWLLEGNHEERLTRLIWGLEGAERELAKLKVFQQAMTWPTMLCLNEVGWKWVDYNNQPRRDILPHLLVKHGTFVSQEAGMTAKREWQKYGKSGISGHTHRANIWRHRDDNGQATWIEAGCLCRFDVPGGNDPNWQQAVTMVEWSEDETLMHVEQVLIRDGRTMWRGELITANG